MTLLLDRVQKQHRARLVHEKYVTECRKNEWLDGRRNQPPPAGKSLLDVKLSSHRREQIVEFHRDAL